MSESRAIVDPEEILSYWFPPGYDADPETFRQQVVRWFQGGPEVGQEITKLFESPLRLRLAPSRVLGTSNPSYA